MTRGWWGSQSWGSFLVFKGPLVVFVTMALFRTIVVVASRALINDAQALTSKLNWQLRVKSWLKPMVDGCTKVKGLFQVSVRFWCWGVENSCVDDGLQHSFISASPWINSIGCQSWWLPQPRGCRNLGKVDETDLTRQICPTESWTAVLTAEVVFSCFVNLQFYLQLKNKISSWMR